MNRTPFSLFCFAAALLAAMSLVSCQPKYVSDYDFRKAQDAYWNDDYDEAMDLVEAQLKVTPNHVDALFLRALLYSANNEYAAALKDVNRALKCYRGEPMVERSRLYVLQGRMLHSEKRFSEAARAFSRAAKLARKDDPGHVQNILFLLAHTYYKMEDRAAAEKVFLQMLEDDPGDVAAMVGLARNRMDEQRYEEALEWLDKAQAIDEDYASVYKFKMQVYDKMDRREACMATALKYLELDEDAPTSALAMYCGKNYADAVARVQARADSSDDPARWLVLLTDLYEDHGDYRSAIAAYDRLMEEVGVEEELLYYRSRCYLELGEFRKAAADLTEAYGLTADWRFLGERGDAFRTGGFYGDAIRDYRTCLEKDPENGYYYYAIGWSYELSGDVSQALHYYDEGVKMDQSYPYLLLSRADLIRADRPTEAMADYEKVLEIDTVPNNGSCRQYALLALGNELEATAWMDRIIAQDTLNSGNYYDKACLCGRMGLLEESLTALEMAFRKGFRRFAHLEHDDDMDPIRNLLKYKALVEKYKSYADHPEPEVATPAREDSGIQRTRTDSVVSEIPVKRRPGGTYEVPCTINGLPLKFIFDTGASDVTLSSVEADFMLKNDYLSERDFRGSRKYLTAAGSVCDGAVICLKEVKVGDVSLRNIEASVVKNQKAPLLLGQSALERLGRITIDNENSRIIIRK